jgi:hypothetical protein
MICGGGLRRWCRCDGLFEPTLDPREPPSSCRCASPRRFRRYGKALKQAQGTHLFVGVQGLALHGEVDFLCFFSDFKIEFQIEKFARRGAGCVAYF